MGISPVTLIIMFAALPLAGSYYRSLESISVPEPTKRRSLIADETDRTRELNAVLAKARTSLAAGDTAAAIRTCEEAHAVYANHPFTYRILSEAYAASGDHYRALNYAQKGIDYDNRYLPNYDMLADAYIRFNEYDRSLQSYLTAYLIELNSGYYLAKAGMLLLSLGETSGAQKYFSMGAAMSDPYCLEGQGVIAVMSNDLASALTSFEHAYAVLEKMRTNDARIPAARERLAARIVRTKYDWLLLLMRANYERGNDAKVMDLGAKAVSLMPEYRSFMLSGLSAARAGDLTNAYLFLTQATNLSPRSSAPYRTLAGVYARFGRTNDAVDVLRDGARNCRTDQELYLELSQYLIQTGDHDEADAAFKRALLFGTFSDRSLPSYARILFGKGEFSAAERYAMEAQAIADRAAMNDIARRAAVRMQLEKARALIRDKAPQQAMNMLQTTNYTGQEESLRIRYMLLAYDALGRIDEPIALLMRELKNGISLINAREIMYFANKFLEHHRTNESSWPVAKRKYAEIAGIVDAWMLNDGMRPSLLSAYFDDIIAYGDFDTAIHAGTLMKKSAAFDPARSVARAYYLKGRAAFADNRPGDAKEALLKALAYDDACHDARFLLNEMHAAEVWRTLRDAEDRGDTTNTVRAYETLLSLAPYDMSPLLPLARAYRSKGDFSNAHAAAEEIRLLSPDKGLGHELIGDNYLAAGNTLDALKAYRQAIRIEPDNPVYRRKTARCFFTLEQYKRAAEEFETLIKTDGAAENWFYYGAALYHLWEYPDAIAAVEKAVMAEPGNPVYRMNYGVILLEAGRAADALEAFNHALLIDASNEDMLFYKARALFYLGRIDESFTIAERLVNASPENALYRFALGAIYDLRSRQILASDVAEYINRAIVQFTQCVSLCKPVRDDELKQDALKRLKDLNPNFHVIAIAQLPAALAAPLANDPKDKRIVYAPLDNGTVCAYDVIGNKPLWQARVAGRVTSPVVYRARHVMFGTESGMFHILRAKDGTSAFTFISGGPITKAALPIVNNKIAKEGGDEVNIIIVPSDDGRVYLIQYLEDEDRFNYQFIQMEGGIATPIVHENGLLFYATERGSIYCVNMRTGRTKWVQRTSGRVSAAPVIINGMLYAASDDGIIYRLSIDDGSVTGTYRYRNSGVKEIVHKDGYLFFGDDFGRFHIIDTDMKNVGIDQLNGAFTEGPIFFGEYIIFGTGDGRLYFKTLARGKDIDRITLDSAVIQKPLALGTSVIGVATQSGAIHLIVVRKPMKKERS